MDIKILVAAHKKYWMPADDVYMPLQVGASKGFEERDLRFEGANQRNKKQVRLYSPFSLPI